MCFAKEGRLLTLIKPCCTYTHTHQDGQCTSIVEVVTELEFRVDFFFLTWFRKTRNFAKSSRCDIEAIKPKRVLCTRRGVKDKKDQVGSGMKRKKVEDFIIVE